MYSTDDVRISEIKELRTPEELINEFPVSENASETVHSARQQISHVLNDKDDRMVVVVGPCSIHDPQAAREYAVKLLEQKTKYEKDLLIVMRIYFEKPRTTIGWKGLINDPNLDNSYHINEGLRAARSLLLDINDMGLPAGTEYLDLISPQYIADLIGWGAIGARTTESQAHRELASGLSCPVGFKNGTTGNVQIAIDAIGSAMHPHHFLSVTKEGKSAIFSTAGNNDCHLILRGGSDSVNYDAASVDLAAERMQKSKIPVRIMIDFSHANSRKKFARQQYVCQDVCAQLAGGEQRIKGVMIESNLVEGNQGLGKGVELTYGQSITDACVGWDNTLEILSMLSQGVKQRREKIR
jgi:3-deoxy-7-phosphoheptulonate synthase